MASFATTSDLADRLRVTFSAADAILAQQLLDGATEAIKAHADQLIEQVTGDTVVLDGYGGVIVRLPQIPVTAVAAVTVNGDALAAGDYVVAGETGLLYRAADGKVTGSTCWPNRSRAIAVTYDHGYATIPPALKTVCIEAAARAWTLPIGSVRQETIGSYSVTFDNRSDGSGDVVSLTAAEQRIVDDYAQLAIA